MGYVKRGFTRTDYAFQIANEKRRSGRYPAGAGEGDESSSESRLWVQLFLAWACDEIINCESQINAKSIRRNRRAERVGFAFVRL